jgi:D-alanine transaminase
MDRLYRSLRELKIPATYTFEELAGFHELLIKESGITDGGIYLQISRGVAPRAHAFPDNSVPRLTMSVRPAGSIADLRATGAKAVFVPDERWMRCDIKSINLLGNLLGKMTAKAAGGFEGVQIRDGVVTEGTSSNFFLVKDGVLWTHPVSNMILRGVTRTFVVDHLAPTLGLTVIEKQFDLAFVQKADEAFLSGTTTEIMPLVTMDATPVGGKTWSVGDGQPGPVTRKLAMAYDALIVKECGKK